MYMRVSLHVYICISVGISVCLFIYTCTHTPRKKTFIQTTNGNVLSFILKALVSEFETSNGIGNGRDILLLLFFFSERSRVFDRGKKDLSAWRAGWVTGIDVLRDIYRTKSFFEISFVFCVHLLLGSADMSMCMYVMCHWMNGCMVYICIYIHACVQNIHEMYVYTHTRAHTYPTACHAKKANPHATPTYREHQNQASLRSTFEP